jgi:hypothetical protein
MDLGNQRAQKPAVDPDFLSDLKMDKVHGFLGNGLDYCSVVLRRKLLLVNC